jgi:hypothetical protein
MSLFFFPLHSRKSSLTSIAFTPLIISYTVEILPFHLRAKGFTIFNLGIALSLIFNQYVNPIALGGSGSRQPCPSVIHISLNIDTIQWKYYVRFLRPPIDPPKAYLKYSLSTAAGSCVKLYFSGSVSFRFSLSRTRSV